MINWDGQLLGCCINSEQSLGNVFSDGLMPTLNGKKMSYAKKMVTGRVGVQDGIPCTKCTKYIHMQQRDGFLTARYVHGTLMRRLAYRLFQRTGPLYRRLAASGESAVQRGR